MGFSKVMLVGNLTRDPEVRTLPSGKPMTRLGLAVNRTWLDKDGERREDVSFFNLVAYSRQAECLAKYARKGARLFVDGRLTARTITNDRGEAHTFHDVIVEQFQLLDKRARGRGAEQPPPDTGQPGEEGEELDDE
ncbi:MAG: single-stranded DNA-binding protein [Candidatus Wallbacteria bacterium]|nr:single-stranded DNA-binding protein [Candidatus Wallbacteria bacterium]